MKFSIITPSFCNSQWLKLCIASVADQQDVEFEHIVQDACSDDGTLDWLPKDPRVKAFIEKDNGMYDAVNRGFRRADGDLLAYINCDEQYLPGALKAVHEFFHKHPEVEVALANTVVVDSECNYVCHRPVLLPSLHSIWVRFPVYTCSIFIRRSVLSQRKLFFNGNWRDLGDKHWFISLLRNKVPMATINCYTSVFVDSGDNMNLRPNALMEKKKTRDMAPKWVIKVQWLFIAQYRLKRLLAGHFNMKPTHYSVYTRKSPNNRITFDVHNPTTIWWNRL